MSVDHNRPADPIASDFIRLLRLPPMALVVAGLFCIAGGGAVAVLLWINGMLWSLPLFAASGGVFLTVSGVLDGRKEKKRREYRESIRERAGDILRGILDAKRQGKYPLRYLSDQGIQDREIRRELIDAMNQRLKGVPS
jgi:hypothetical protein